MSKLNELIDCELCFFYVCQILNTRSEIYEKYRFQLDHLETENLLHIFGVNLHNSLLRRSKTLDQHAISRISKNTITVAVVVDTNLIFLPFFYFV
jgi:hypothetical protein